MNSYFHFNLGRLNSKYTYYALIGLSLLILLVGFLTSHILAIVALAIALVTILIASSDAIVCFLMLFMPFASIFKYAPGTLSLFTICECFGLIVLFFRTKKISASIIITGIVYLVYLLLGDVISGSSDLFEIIKQVVGILLLFLMIRNMNISSYKSIMLFFILGLLISSILALFSESIPHFYDFVKEVRYNDETTTYNRFTGLQGDPNYFSINVIISILLLLVLFVKNELKSLVFWILFITLSVFGILTLSKSFILMYGLVSLYLIIRILKKKKVINIILVFAFIIGVLLLLNKEGSILNVLMNRLLEADNMSELTTGRVVHYEEYFNHIVNNTNVLLFGSGLNVGPLNEAGSHNFYLESIYYLGIFGTIVLVVNILIGIRFNYKFKRKLINYSGYVILLIMYFFLQMLFAYELIFHILLTYLIFNINFDKKNVKENE